jgi:hypothetical protein
VYIYHDELVYTGFRGAHRDSTVCDAVQPPIGSDSEQPLEEMDPLPCPEDEEFFVSPDSASMEEAIGKFMEGLESQESSNVYEVNLWMWQFGRRKPRLGGLTVKQTAARQEIASKERRQRAAETRRSRKAAKA